MPQPDHVPSQPQTAPPPRWLAIGALLLLCVYAIFIATHMGAYAAGSDSSGYMNSAKLFSQGTISMPQRTIPGLDDPALPPRLYIPLGFEVSANRRMAPTYSTGLPLAMNAVAPLTGWKAAPHITIFLFSLAGVLLTAWLACEWGLPREWAFAATLLIACCPLYLMYSMHLMSDMPAMVFTTAALLFAWKSRARPGWAALAGLTFACSVLMRHTNALLLPALAICLGLGWRRWLLFGLAGLPGGMFYCLYNYANYGHYFQTGYDGLGELIKLGYLPLALCEYSWGLPALLTPFVFLALGMPWIIRREPLRVSALISWIVCLFGFYSLYSYTHQTLWYLRFVLPAFPALAIGCLLVLRAAFQTQPVQRLTARLAETVRQPVSPLMILAWAIMIPAALYVYRENQYAPKRLRLVLTLAPILVPVALHEIQRRLKSSPAQAIRWMGMTLLVGMICVSDLIWTQQLGWLYVAQGEAAYPKACAWANQNLPANSVVYTMQTSGALLYYTPFTLVRYDYVEEREQTEIEKACAATNRPIYAMLFPFEVKAMQDNHMLDRWTQIAAMAPITVWRLDPGKAPAAP